MIVPTPGVTFRIVFFIVEGRVDYYLEHYKIVYRTVMTGSYFGDYEVINATLRQNTTRTKTGCSMLILTKDVFPALLTLLRITRRL